MLAHILVWCSGQLSVGSVLAITHLPPLPSPAAITNPDYTVFYLAPGGKEGVALGDLPIPPPSSQSNCAGEPLPTPSYTSTYTARSMSLPAVRVRADPTLANLNHVSLIGIRSFLQLLTRCPFPLRFSDHFILHGTNN